LPALLERPQRLLFCFQQRVKRKGIRAVILEFIGDRPACEIDLALAFVSAGDAQALQIAHDCRISAFELVRVYAKRKE
jgi:hypothetical protein